MYLPLLIRLEFEYNLTYTFVVESDLDEENSMRSKDGAGFLLRDCCEFKFHDFQFLFSFKFVVGL